MEKQCSKCKQYYSYSSFTKDKNKPDGYYSSCKTCKLTYMKDYDSKHKYLHRKKVQTWRRSSSTNLKYLYGQIALRIKRDPYYFNRPCTFTYNEFYHQCYNKRYLEILREWELNGFIHKLAPTVDRINNNRGYDIDNIQIITKSENSSKRKFDLQSRKVGLLSGT